MVPILFVQNATDSSISTLNVEDEYLSLELGEIEKLFGMDPGTYAASGFKFHVITIEALTFCVCSIANTRDYNGKQFKVPIDYEYAKRYCIEISNLLYLQSKEIINHVHDIQYLVGALLHNSIVIDGKNYTEEHLREKLKNISHVTGVMQAKSKYFQYLTEDINVMKVYDVSVVDKAYKIHKTVDFLSRSLDGKVITSEFTVVPDKSRCFVRAPNILDFIPFQLVENAIKYSPRDGYVDITVCDSSDSVRLEVESMGPRIDTDELERIFEKGYRGRHGKLFSEQGHGLGLYQTKKALEELVDGRISVEQPSQSFTQFSGIDFCHTRFCATFNKNSN